MRTSIGLCAIFLTIVFFTACGTRARLVRSWSDPDHPARAMKNILVIGISRDENAIRLWENVFVDAFRRLGVRAEAGHKVIGPLPEPNRRVIEDAARGTGAGAVLITRLVDVSTETVTHPGMVHFEPRTTYRTLDGYYGTAYRAARMPPVDVTRTRVSLESNLYDAATGRLLWSARTEARDPKLLRSDYEQVISLLVSDLRNKGLLR